MARILIVDDQLHIRELNDIRNAFHDLPVILNTAYESYKHDMKSIAADYYVVKSSDLRDLKLKIKMALEDRKEFNDA
ncbi:MAG: hypothetical protein JRK53_14330 [Deltaproteobacteria bacterium]|nr:hypothetical protein [Deltaproteobacteria bacterium]